MELRFTGAAETELQEAKRYYGALNPALAGLFHAEARTAVRRILAHPRAWPRESHDIRRFVLNRFPYKLLYAIEPDHIIVLAVAHQHQRPGYWRYRISE